MENSIMYPFLSKLSIKNFRNFKELNINLKDKQIVIGENNVGKSNLIKAIQLILDPSLSEQDRTLKERDFYDGLENPMDNQHEIIIQLEIQGFDHNKQLKALLCDATVNETPHTARLTYKYKVIDTATNEYGYVIYQGEDEDISFGYKERKVLNFMVIDAIRDVATDLKNERKSPIKKLINRLDISENQLKEIAAAMKENNDQILNIDEIGILIKSINRQLETVVSKKTNSNIDLQTNEIVPSRVLNNINLVIGEKGRGVKESSLGLNNLIYITLLMMQLEDETIPSLIKETDYTETLNFEDGKYEDLLKHCYVKNQNNNYLLKENIDSEKYIKLYKFFDNNRTKESTYTLLAIEEPEAHLHPAIQRTVYKEVMKRNTSILISTHSPFITSVVPMNSIVHLIPNSNLGSKGFSTAEISLTDREMMDLQRYIDVKRGELYFGKGVILVEGIAEEYLIPVFSKLLGYDLDLNGIICCNINGTDFKPYITLLRELGIPYVVITDGDYYFYENDSDSKVFNKLHNTSHNYYGYDGNDRMIKLNKELDLFSHDIITSVSKNIEVVEIFNKHHIFIGVHTFEVDIMSKISNCYESQDILFNLFDTLTLGGDIQKKNFKESYKAGEFDKCLAKIESSSSKIGKGRFAQSLANCCTKAFIPIYIENAIKDIFSQVDIQ